MGAHSVLGAAVNCLIAPSMIPINRNSNGSRGLTTQFGKVARHAIGGSVA